MTSGVLLHSRSRGAVPGGLTLLAIAALAPLTARALPHSADGRLLTHLQVLSVTAASALVGGSLTGHDPDLETSTPRTRPRLRLAHLAVSLLAVATALTAGLALLARSPGAGLRPDLLLTARDTAALGGLLALVAPVLGARLSWLPPAAWVLVLLAVGPQDHGWRLVASTPLLPGPTTAASVTAVVLLAAGAALYSHRAAPG